LRTPKIGVFQQSLSGEPALRELIFYGPDHGYGRHEFAAKELLEAAIARFCGTLLWI
jgi:hypothetical protein